ncbi:MAG: MoaD/ThiS family protein [candidate division NC10 bacterium]|nr:MoaD/ThiS family protein [candidate division NC10 bacterium]MBI3080306.1 MoaD/ThiS family protein [candidate division NC10 bacterium]MBI4413569.1 MoaD/ThiS family protein [candidate division NC10 bacterium]
MQGTELGVREPIAVKVVMLGKSTQELVRDPGTTLGDILAEQGVAGQMEVRVNGETANPARRLADRDVVLLVPKIRGGAR